MTTTVSQFDPISLLGQYKPKPTDAKVGTVDEQPQAPSPTPPAAETRSEPSREPHPMDGETDDKGTPFDAAKHLPTRRKTKRYNDKGIWMPRKPKKTAASDAPKTDFGFRPPEPAPPPAEPEEPKPERKRPALLENGGQALAGLWYQMNTILHGNDALPRNKMEEVLIPAAFQECVDEYAGGLDDIPAWLGLGIALGQYELVRFAAPKEPTTREKMLGIGAVLKARAVSLWGRVFGRKEKADTQESEQEGGQQ